MVEQNISSSFSVYNTYVARDLVQTSVDVEIFLYYTIEIILYYIFEHLYIPFTVNSFLQLFNARFPGEVIVYV